MKCKHFWNVIAGLTLVVFTVTGLADSNKLSKKLKGKAQGGGNDKVSVIVQYHAKPNSAEDSRLNGLGATDKRAYGQLKMRALKIKAKKLNALVNDPDVKFVTLDSPVESFTEAARLADRVVDCDDNNCEDDYLELSGTSMAAAVVSATVALMLDDDASLSPDTIKARLMRSARKIDGDPTVVGTGVLDISAALNETGVMTVPALSPMMALGTADDGSQVILVENSG